MSGRPIKRTLRASGASSMASRWNAIVALQLPSPMNSPQVIKEPRVRQLFSGV